VKACTNSLIEHITHETAEISNVQKRITDLNVEAQSATAPTPQNIQDSAVTYLDNSEQPQNVQTILPEAPINEPITSTFDSPSEAEALPPVQEAPVEAEAATTFPEPPQQVTPETSKDTTDDNDWLARMEAQ
jgi:hypothetical protein